MDFDKDYIYPNSATIDHLVDIADGGTNHQDNLVLACDDCNQRRGRLAELRRNTGMTQHVMLDLETVGDHSYAGIVAIGAVKFNPFNPRDPLDSFYVAIDMASLPANGFTGSTVNWWFDPARDEARRELVKADKVDIKSALDGFSEWYGNDASLPVWGNGADFDNVILRNAYTVQGMEPPWSKWGNRCYRTVKNFRPDIRIERTKMHHHALGDAVNQARHLQELVKVLGIQVAV